MKHVIRAHVPGAALAGVLGQQPACSVCALKGLFSPRNRDMHGAFKTHVRKHG